MKGSLAAKGFRPFFLVAGAFAAAIVPIWLLALAGVVRVDAYFEATRWHAHEMVFGFGCAVIAGFLLTAAANWTGRETLTGAPLLGLAALWCGARIALVTPGFPRWAAAVVDLAFLPAVALAIGRPLVEKKQRRNYVMLAVLLALWGANAATHLDVLGAGPDGSRRGVVLGVDLVVLLIVVVAGRIFPMFTRNATGVASIRSHPRLDAAAVGAMSLVTIADALAAGGALTALACAAAALFAAARAVHWGTRHVWRDPLVWILHVGYAWVPIGLALRVASYWTPSLPASLATHALTVGAIGGVTLGMMARVSLGHTGRLLVAGRPVFAAFVLVTAAAVARVLVPLLDMGSYPTALLVSGGLWAASFALFTVAYAGVLVRPRIDDRPG